MGWGASDIDPAGKAVVMGAYAPAARGRFGACGCCAGPPSFFFCRIVAVLDFIRDNGGRNEVMADVDV